MIVNWFRSVGSLFSKARKDRKGAAMAEYAVLLAGVCLISLVAVSVLGHKVNDMFGAVASILPGAHTDDNGSLVSGHLVETTFDTTNKQVLLDVTGIVANGGTKRLGTNLGVDLTNLVVEP